MFCISICMMLQYRQTTLELLKDLPCLVKTEKTVIQSCRHQANATAEAMQAIQKATETKQYSDLTNLLTNLCRYY